MEDTVGTATKKVTVPELNEEALKVALKDFVPGEAQANLDNSIKFVQNPTITAAILLGTIAILGEEPEKVIGAIAHSFFVLGIKYAKALESIK